MTTFVLATANPDKAREIVALLGEEAPSLELVARPPEVPDVDEVGETLEENARIKALARKHGLPVFIFGSGSNVLHWAPLVKIKVKVNFDFTTPKRDKERTNGPRDRERTNGPRQRADKWTICRLA